MRFSAVIGKPFKYLHVIRNILALQNGGRHARIRFSIFTDAFTNLCTILLTFITILLHLAVLYKRVTRQQYSEFMKDAVKERYNGTKLMI